MNDPNTTPETEAPRGCFRWDIVVLLMASLLVLLGWQLWRKLDDVDPLKRCAGAYDNIHTAVDTSLVDGIEIRWPDEDTRTTCGEVRRSGQLDSLPKRAPTGGGLMPPPPADDRGIR